MDKIGRYVSASNTSNTGNYIQSADGNSELSQSERDLALQSEESPDATAPHQSENEEVQSSDTTEETDVEQGVHTNPKTTVKETPMIKKSQWENKQVFH